MPSPAPEARLLAEGYRLGAADAPLRGAAGDRLGRGTGASLEFQDRRSYVPGDDPRQLDWAAFARTDQLLVRLHREEVQPRLELLVDDSRSMAVEERKAHLAVDLAALLLSAARGSGFELRLVAVGDRPELCEPERFEARGLELDGVLPLERGLEAARGLLRPGCLRILISDFLSPHEAPRVVRSLAAQAGGLILLQVLAEEDARPPEGAALRLTDSETGERSDLVLDRVVLAVYRRRLRRLADDLQRECRRVGGGFRTLVADRDLEAICRDQLAPAGVLVPR